jgi:hypothetical protein
VPDDLALPPTRSYVPAQRTLERILSRPLPDAIAAGLGVPLRRRRRPSRRRVIVAASAAAVVALVAAAAAWIVTKSPSDPVRVACYSSASLKADAALLRTEPSDGPVAACAEVWRSGAFRSVSSTTPALAACVLSSGAVGVFPGDASVCDQLGLPRVATDSGGLTTVGVALIDKLVAALAAPNCVDVAAAADLVREQLDQAGLAGWTLITPATVASDKPCASIAFDPSSKTITLVPVPVPGSS